ncbi:hypothetical protein [Martelella sp. HB161492]|uniref:hypothetical protein n=1 Tax=Martelella sp. HB161492 TaxID=2720726 RepID=UPI0015920B93|nr:hypothetical protein [Martelella sp. HB161492]
MFLAVLSLIFHPMGTALARYRLANDRKHLDRELSRLPCHLLDDLAGDDRPWRRD